MGAFSENRLRRSFALPLPGRRHADTPIRSVRWRGLEKILAFLYWLSSVTALYAGSQSNQARVGNASDASRYEDGSAIRRLVLCRLLSS